jgi:CubicO group peptidase (beta-lactamase class C family)
LAVAALVSLNACGPSRNPSPTVSIDKLFAEWNRADAPGCAVGISHNGAIVYEHGYGMANLERGVPITPATVFPIASVSKAFTAMSVLFAAEHGQLSLDDEVQKFIPEWVDREDHITIRHLLTHTSGLRDAFTLLGALKNGGWVDTTVRGFSKDVFAGDVVGIVKFSRDARGAVTGFTVNRGGARDVRFDRVRRR